MQRKKILYSVMFLAGMMSISFAQTSRLDPMVCARITNSGDRLSCFDSIFYISGSDQDTMVAVPAKKTGKSQVKTATMPPNEWNNAWSKDRNRDDVQGFFQTVAQSNLFGAVTLTLPIDEIGLMVLSCEGKKTQVKIMLNQPTVEAETIVTIDAGDNKLNTDIWTRDKSGYILQMAPDTPSIELINFLLLQQMVSLNLGEKSVIFSVADLSEKIGLLRDTCGW